MYYLEKIFKLIKPLIELLAFFIYYCFDALVISCKQVSPRSILIIRLDGLGDYILFRNYLRVLRESEKYKNYTVTFLGNEVFKDLAEELDKQYIDKFLWINIKKYSFNFFYRLKKLREISSTGYEILIHPTFSRDFFYSELIVKKIFAKEKIGSIGDLSNLRVWQKKISDRYYTNLLPARKEIMFEFFRNKEFFENLLETKINIKKPLINLKNKVKPFNPSTKYAILFIGAGLKSKKWNVRNFAEVGKYLKQRYGYEIILCGSKNEISDEKKFKTYFHENYINLVGKTSLMDLLDVINHGDLILSNDTGIVHLAVAMEKKNIFVIFQGNHFGRFIPYPSEIACGFYPIYHPEIKKNIDDYNKLANNYGFVSSLNINEITVEMVKNELDKVLSSDG